MCEADKIIDGKVVCAMETKDQHPSAESVKMCICGEIWDINHACRGFKLREKISQQERMIAELNSECDTKTDRILTLERQLKEAKEIAQAMTVELNTQNKEIIDLEQQMRQLKEATEKTK